ncbi:hypothetical protein CKM354_000263200 [Cercospora kikuchii]|uniref:Fe2OG dioxygenase domain-containing protein n=1 Tax=Cercospora kikuchii TaxID=84275 RepID=A0A9P3F9H5_9PEZI|nr:uncharacterized protein CKM354_000263200 [Cercospora kikuchii]GIZ39241.1 hypothetical protein CKM354_000263200 [Cercospora kikuchii]
MSKRIRTLDSFFSPPPTKRTKAQQTIEDDSQKESDATNNASDVEARSEHATYPFSLPLLPQPLQELLNFIPASEGKLIQDQPDLDLVYYTPFIPKEAQKDLFEFLRQELFFYRVKYNIKRGPVETAINTPRFTTVFGVDQTARFKGDEVCHTVSGAPVPKETYKCRPRPMPQCLDILRELTENATGCRFNFALVNYYADGNDSISYHSDDERFLGNEPSIASFTLGGTRDFLLKHKPTPQNHISETKPTKLPLTSGDMVLMRGKTQSCWLHSIPKRKGPQGQIGRINITFRRAMVRGGTENYYRYNVGEGVPYKWSASRREMVPWTSPLASSVPS